MKIKDFTNQELINALVKWMRDPTNEEAHVWCIADDIEDGSWLEYYEDKINK